MILYDWAGSRILPFPVVRNRRYIRCHDFDIPVKMDIRQWVVPSHCWELRDKAERLFNNPGGNPVGPLDFDKRAWLCWKYVVDTFAYEHDSDRDLWLLPSETLARGSGDCEDLSFLLASLLLMAGISSHCVRVVFGPLLMLAEHLEEDEENGRMSRVAEWQDWGTHAWVIYKNIHGHWCVLDPTIESSELTNTWIEVTHSHSEFFEAGIRRYKPMWCCNHEHVWGIDPTITAWEPELYENK